MPEYITRDEHSEAMRRLDEADRELRKQMIDTERVLRVETDDKISKAIDSFAEKVAVVQENVKEDVKGIEDHLDWQDKLLWGTIATIVATIIGFGALHFLHIG